MKDRKIDSLSIYFFAGEFEVVLRRHAEGMPHAYGTHDAIAKLVHDLADAGVAVSIYSFCTPQVKEEQPREKVRVISLGARSYREGKLLERAVREDSSDAIIAHFPNVDLLAAVAGTGKPALAMLASSFYERGLQSYFTKKRMVSLLNRPEFELVSNHCLPATEHLADLGVQMGKLIPWDVPHPFTPVDSRPKAAAPIAPFKIMYAGVISEKKGVGDVIRAIPHLRFAADAVFTFAGEGEIGAMRRLASSIVRGDKAEFLGAISNPEVFERFKSADLVLVPSRREFQEGFPLAMFEAIASRTPIVCSDHPIFHRLMSDRKQAMLFRSGDHRALARAIDAVLSDPDLYLRLSNAAPKTWEKLQGPADWRQLIVEWVRNGPQSEWIRSRLLYNEQDVRKAVPVSA